MEITNGIDFLIGAEMTEEVKTILNELSLEEKIALCSGKDFWHNLLELYVTIIGCHGRKMAKRFVWKAI